MAGQAGMVYKSGGWKPAESISSGREFLTTLDARFGSGAGRIRLASEIRGARRQVRGLTELMGEIRTGKAPRSVSRSRVQTTLTSERRRLSKLRALAKQMR